MLLLRANSFVEGAKECGLDILPYRDGFFISIPCDDPMKACEELAKENLYLVPLISFIFNSHSSQPHHIALIKPGCVFIIFSTSSKL